MPATNKPETIIATESMSLADLMAAVSDKSAKLIKPKKPEEHKPKPMIITPVKQSVPQPKPTAEVITVEPIAPAQPTTTTAVGIDPAVIVNSFIAVKDEFLNAFRDDRTRLQQFIDQFATYIETAGAECREAIIAGLTSLLSTKAKATSDAMRSLDSMAKMTSAIKSMTQTTKAADVDLDILLRDNEPDDDQP